jgi:hypothetical protein
MPNTSSPQICWAGPKKRGSYEGGGEGRGFVGHAGPQALGSVVAFGGVLRGERVFVVAGELREGVGV